ncbi:MAG: hypothetical protein ABGY42_11845 [bacterium]
MKFLTLMLAAVMTLAFSFTATPAAALDPLAKCRVYNAKIKMNYAKCLELDNLLVEKGKAAKGICDSKRTASLEKATAKFVTKLSVSPEDCGIDTDTADAQRDVQLLASANSQSACEDANGTWDNDVCTADPTSDNTAIAAAAGQAACEAADGLWFVNDFDEDECAPAPVTDRDCFREGACGADGFNHGYYAGVNLSSSGCSDTTAGSTSYNRGTEVVSVIWNNGSEEGSAKWVICVTN